MWEWIKLIGIAFLIIGLIEWFIVWLIYLFNKDKIIEVREEDL